MQSAKRQSVFKHKSAEQLGPFSTADKRAEHPVQNTIDNMAVQQCFIQSKLTVSQAGDPYEKEADAVADQVMRKPMGEGQAIQVSPLNPNRHHKCTQCEPREEQGVSSVQRKANHGSSAENHVSENLVATATQAGRPLDHSARMFFEPRFGRSLGDVKVHTNGYSNQVAQTLNAKAFTAGNDIVFAPGQYQPNSIPGRHLLAHELTHVIQQRNAPTIAPMKQRPTGTPKQSISSSRPLISSLKTSARVQRQEADTETESISHAGQILTENSAQLMGVLEDIAIKQGLVGAKNFVESLVGAIGGAMPKATGKGGAGGVGNAEASPGTAGGEGMGGESNLEQRIKVELRRQYRLFDKKVDQLLNNFEMHALNTMNEMLFDSERKLYAESEKYGIKTEGVKASTFLSDSTTTPGAPSGGGTTYSLTENMQTEALRDAARAMWPHRNELDDLNAKRDKLMVRQVSNNEGPMPRYAITDQAQYDELSRKITEKTKAYEVLRVKNLAGFPILAAFAGQGGAADLQQISQGGTGAGNTVGGLITKQLENIEKVRVGLYSESLEIWSVPTVINGTKLQLAFVPGTLGAKLVDDEMQTIAITNTLVQIAVGVVAIALGLVAAIPTAGTSMGVGIGVATANIGSAALSAYMAGTALQNYEMAQAMNGTDPDKARAISQSDPSLFWLALDIVGAVLDITQALRVFNQLASMQRAVSALPVSVAGAVEDGATQALRQTGNRIRQGVGDRLVSEARTAASVSSDASTAVRIADNTEDYLAAIRNQKGGNNVGWDHARFPSAPRGSKWQHGDPIDMPSASGGYPTFDTARKRFWKNRADAEMQRRASGQANQHGGEISVNSLSDDELRRIADSGSAPVDPITGRKIELEHAGVPQRVERWLKGIGFSAEEARRLADVSNPHALMDLEPLEHAFFDAEAWSFGRQRAGIDGRKWSGTVASDSRVNRPMIFMTDEKLTRLLGEISNRNLDLQSNPQLRALLINEASLRGIPVGNL